jgi:aminoglycoside 3-N-acetyltransferase
MIVAVSTLKGAHPVNGVTHYDIVEGLRQLGLDTSSSVIVHSSLHSFGHVEGGASTVCAALREECGTLLLPAGTWDVCGIPAPPGLERPHNAVHMAESWQEFDAALAAASAFTSDLPIDRELGIIPETMRRTHDVVRSEHPLFSYLAVGHHAEELIVSQTLSDPLAPVATLEHLGGYVLLIGISHTSNTAIHLAEQRLGRSRFWRYARVAAGLWMELPNIPGESAGFDVIEPVLAPVTREVMIGSSRVRLVAVADVTAAATRMILANPAALLTDDASPDSRDAASLQQRLARIEQEQ